jgi:putative transposase
LTDEATLAAALDCLLEHIPLEMAGGYQPKDLFEILLRAASRTDSIEQTSHSLQGTPTGNATRYHLDKLTDIGQLEQQINAALQSRLPSKIRQGKHRLAIDLHLIPDYGRANPVELPYLYRSQARAGTTCFFA